MASFYHTIPEPDDLVCCPYDKVHMVRWKKLPYHLMKCRKNHPNIKMMACHFNARHEIPEAEFRYHLSTCPDKHVVERLKAEADSANWVRGNCDVPTYFPDNLIMPENQEDWESESVQPRIGVPARDMAGIGYYKNVSGLKPSQKRQYYENIRRGDDEANVRLMESLHTFSIDDNERKQREDALMVEAAKKAEIAPPPPVTMNSMAQPTIGRGRGIAKRMPVTPGAAAATPPQPTSSVPATPQERAKTIRRTKKKLEQIDRLVERQANGEMLNEEERVKVALKSTLLAQIAMLEKADQ